MAGAAPFLITFLIAFLFAYNTGRIAARKGRRAVPWAMLGLFRGIFGLDRLPHPGKGTRARLSSSGLRSPTARADLSHALKGVKAPIRA
jgi:hypothetical protein